MASAQDRMPPIPKENQTEAQRKILEEIAAGPRGGVPAPFIPLSRSPELMTRLQKTGEFLRYDTILGPKLSEMIILIIARQWTQQNEWSIHAPIALKAGVSAGMIEAIADGRRPQNMAEDEETVYDFCDELLRNRSISDATYARALKQFGEQGVIEMTGVNGYYTTLAMIMNVARTALPEGTPAPLQPFPN